MFPCALWSLLNLLQGFQSTRWMHGSTFNIWFDEWNQIRSGHIRWYVWRPIAETLQYTNATLVAHANVIRNGECIFYGRWCNLRHLFVTAWKWDFPILQPNNVQFYLDRIGNGIRINVQTRWTLMSAADMMMVLLLLIHVIVRLWRGMIVRVLVQLVGNLLHVLLNFHVCFEIWILLFCRHFFNVHRTVLSNQ